MKKLLFLSAALLTVLCVNAASIQWQITGVTPTSGESIPASTYWTYCFLTSDSSGLNTTYDVATLISQITSGTDPFDSGLKWGNYVGVSGNLDTQQYSIDLPGDVSADKPVTMHAYAIVIDAKDATSMNYYRTVDCGDVEFTDAEGLLWAAGDFVTNGSGNWPGMEPVPEPTSGLLLLLGLCGVGLKRKRA